MIDDRRLGGSGEPEMSPLFMDTGCEPNSPGSPSAEECPSNTLVSERESERQQVGSRGSKRRDKNRDAARKSRKKQTERADELHEELQQLERSNAALHKEIATLRKQLHEYETSLKRHEPHCLLGASSTDRRSSSSPPKVPAKVSNSTLAAASSLSTSLTSSLGLATTSASSAGTSAEPVTVPYSASFLAHSAPHSLFSDAAQITSRPTNAVPSLLANSPARNIRETSAASFTVDAFLTKQTPFPAASPCAVPPYPRLPQLHPCQFSPNRSSPPAAAAQSLSVPPQASLQPSPALPFSLNPSYTSPSPASLLSLLTVPSPLNVLQTKSSSTDRALSQPSPPDLGPDLGLDLSELLENNDWILSGPPSTTE
ncbi:basic leucine zipper transcriptional factor ATF-like 2 [Amphiprion ocellaris]|uniref:basic leucine zipper transcriptional factor ATF-like 2 n=1 Tax=Amphiprion ocellaris TaxID=80972 RepID=UPI000C2FF8EA|nr:basic leucine zipper transcriptional factor ATF-like 2 [Amphiprion ocellaris]XP_054863492.1 basic leucine zipper transcriptional factor ATF-like 2 [Amphiprion ocellaris]